MADQPKPPSVEEVFNRNLDDLLTERGLEHRDLLDLLEAAEYTPNAPATVLLNDAVAMAAVLGVSPWQLLAPADGEAVSITPGIESEGRLARLWLRALAPLRNEDNADFFRAAPLEDLDADLVAEHWVWGERIRTTGLTLALNDAVDRQDVEEVRILSELASRLLNQQALERADRRVPRPVSAPELETAVTRATRFRRQVVPRLAGRKTQNR
ncbi:MAG: hypothetical protein OER12_03380 [Acidimicrobiia bacterium]|nr:hypothetical protein [Acidimicrobiia bacterium]